MCARSAHVARSERWHGRAARRVNAHVIELMRLRGGDDSASASPVEIADAFKREYAAHRTATSTTRDRWSLMGAVSIPWRSERERLTLHAVTYAHAGGRYGLSQEWFSVFDERRGEPLTMRDIIADSAAATSIVERFFRRAKALPDAGSLAAYGWSFPHDRFTLSPNIGLNAQGVVFHWNPYVIAPAISGATTLVVPYDSLQPALARGIAP